MIIAQLMTATWFLRPEKCCCCMLMKAWYMSASWCVVVSVVVIVAVCWWRLSTSVSLGVLLFLLLLNVDEGLEHQWVLVCCCFHCFRCCCMLMKAWYISESWCVVVSVVAIVAVCWWRLGTSVSLGVLLFLLLLLLLYVDEGLVHQWVLVCCFRCCYCCCMLMKAWYISESWCVVVSVVAIVAVCWWRLGTSVSLGVLFPLLLYVGEGSVHQLVLVCCCFCCCCMLVKAQYISASWCVVSAVAVAAVCWWRRGGTAAAPAPRLQRGNTSGRRSSSTLQHKICVESQNRCRSMIVLVEQKKH